MKIKTPVLIVIVAVTALLFLNQTAYAQSSQVSSTINLIHLNVQLTYPSQVQPGQSVTVNVQAMATDSFKLGSLTMQIYIANPNSLEQIASVTVAQNVSMVRGGQFNKNVQLTVPQDAQRTSMIARVSENVIETIFIVYNNVEAAPYESATSDDALTPLSYITATTPEYVALQAQYQTLQSQLEQVQQTLNQTKTQLSQQKTLLSAKNATINQLNEQMTYASESIETYQGISLVLGFVTAALAILCVSQRATRPREREALVESITVAKSAQMSGTAEGKPKRKLNLKKISVAAIVILVIVISAWMAAGYYYSTAAQANANTTTTKGQTYTTITSHSTTTSTGQTGYTSVTVCNGNGVVTVCKTSTITTGLSTQTTHT